MSEPVCHLEEFFMTRVNLAWHDPRETTSVTVEHEFDYEVHQNTKQKNLFRLVFRFGLSSQTPAPVGYSLDSEIVGYFSFPEESSQESMEMLIRYNGCAILYGILRGQIANITGSFPHPKLVLPTVMMEDVVKNIEKRKAEVLKTASAKITNKTSKRAKSSKKK